MNTTVFDPQTITFLWQYMMAADDEILHAVADLPDEGYHRDLDISMGSVHKQLVHCMEAQRLWLSRMQNQASAFRDLGAIPRDQVPTQWKALHETLLTFSRQQTRESISAVILTQTRVGKRYEVAIGTAMLHVADHASYHRGQLNSMIKLAGGTPSHIMLYPWAIDQGQGAWK